MSVGIRKIRSFWQKPFVSNTGGLVVLRGTNTVIRMLVLFILARAFTPDYFGTIVFALAAVDVAKMLADFGVDTVAVREFAQATVQQQQAAFARTVAATKFVFGVATYLVLVGYLALTQNQLQIQVGAVLGILIVTSLWNNLSIDYFQARLETAKIIGPITAVNIVTAIVFGTLIFIFQINILIAVAIFPVTELITSLILFARLRKELHISQHKTTFQQIQRLIIQSLPLALTAIIVTLYTRLDVFFLNNLHDTAEVGYYGIAFRLTEPFQLVAVAFTTSTYSQLSKVFANDRQQAYRVARKYGLATLGYGALSCVCLFTIFPIVISYVLPQYIPASDILRVLSVALIFRAMNGFLTSVVQAQGYFSRITVIAIINMCIIVILLFLLVPTFGALGASFALLIGEVINTLLQSLLISQIHRKTHTLSVTNVHV